MMRPVLILLATLPLVTGLAAQNAPAVADGDWPMYSRDAAGTRFSPLTQITPGNVSRLQQAWTVQLAAAGGRGRGRAGGRGADPFGNTGSNPAATPIVVDGVMYLPAGGNKVLAFEAHTGREIWRHELPRGFNSSSHGVAYWPGERGTAPRILMTAGARLIALDAATGARAAGFGTDGVVDIAVGWSGVPLVYRNVVMLGATVGEVPNGPPGNTRAFDARTGKKLWEFSTIAQPGRPGHDSWADEGWKGRSGANVWAWYMTLDAERGILYMPVSGPAANYYGGDRPGNNLYANSIVAVDAETGTYRWHFQTVHHDLWDSDMPSPPVLVDIRRNGRQIPALASIGKTGWMFILDRVTGTPIFGVEERPVPKGNVPGEWYSPTQPFPVKPGPLARVDFNLERDLVRAEDTSADHVEACRALVEKSGGFYNAGPFTPFLFQEDGAPPRSTSQFPGGTGGVNWGGPAADPTTGYVFIHTHDTSLVGWIEKKKPGLVYGRGTEGSTLEYDRASVDGAGPYFSFSAPYRTAAGDSVTLPCQRPPWSRLVAVDANTGEVAWGSTLGINEALPEGRRRVGGSGSAGPSVTAGSLVFVGATDDRHFRAFDAKTGSELWSTRLPATVNANPLIYRGRDGKQYVAFIATSSVHAFALP